MPSLNIERSIEINAPKELVYSALNDFEKWTKWSPWLIMDPDAMVDIADDGRSYSWKGDRIGEGNMKIRSEKENESMTFDLIFLKPWKSVSSTKFELRTVGDSTNVTWSMNSSLPIFMFWMKKMMSAFVGADYERGLHMLKSFIEEGEVHSALEFEGFEQHEGCEWIGIETVCELDIVGTEMAADYAMIWAVVEASPDLIVGNNFTIYHKWDLVRKSVSYTAAIPVDKIPGNLPDNFTSGKLPASNVYKLKHVGSYEHLGNAWSTGNNMMRNKEFRHLKKIDPYEVYLNNPKDTPQKDLVTVLHFPVK